MFDRRTLAGMLAGAGWYRVSLTVTEWQGGPFAAPRTGKSVLLFKNET
jgi:hypothetical protein